MSRVPDDHDPLAPVDPVLHGLIQAAVESAEKWDSGTPAVRDFARVGTVLRSYDALCALLLENDTDSEFRAYRRAIADEARARLLAIRQGEGT